MQSIGAYHIARGGIFSRIMGKITLATPQPGHLKFTGTIFRVVQHMAANERAPGIQGRDLLSRVCVCVLTCACVVISGRPCRSWRNTFAQPKTNDILRNLYISRSSAHQHPTKRHTHTHTDKTHTPTTHAHGLKSTRGGMGFNPWPCMLFFALPEAYYWVNKRERERARERDLQSSETHTFPPPPGNRKYSS
jgi:hypothetical protein